MSKDRGELKDKAWKKYRSPSNNCFDKDERANHELMDDYEAVFSDAFNIGYDAALSKALGER